MTFEYQILAVTSVFFLLAFAPSSLAKKRAFGFKWLASNRTPVAGKELPAWGLRAERAHQNLKDNFPGFVAAILLLGIQQKFDQGTAIASGIYLVCRLGHMMVYIWGNVPLRALFFFGGLIANIYLLIKAIL